MHHLIIITHYFLTELQESELNKKLAEIKQDFPNTAIKAVLLDDAHELPELKGGCQK